MLRPERGALDTSASPRRFARAGPGPVVHAGYPQRVHGVLSFVDNAQAGRPNLVDNRVALPARRPVLFVLPEGARRDRGGRDHIKTPAEITSTLSESRVRQPPRSHQGDGSAAGTGKGAAITSRRHEQSRGRFLRALPCPPPGGRRSAGRDRHPGVGTPVGRGKPPLTLSAGLLP